jgi:hypothetical protein
MGTEGLSPGMKHSPGAMLITHQHLLPISVCMVVTGQLYFSVFVQLA